MDFIINKEQEQFKRETIEFAKNNLNEKEFFNNFSTKMWNKTADFGLLGITIGEEYGGLGESYLTASLIFEALGYGCKNNGFVFAVNNHIWVAQNLIYLYGTKILKDKYVKDMVKGNKIGAIAITEADSGSDALSMSTKAIEKEGYFYISGSKMFVSNGPIADLFIVFAVTEEEPKKKITAFVVEKDFNGIKVSEDINKMGLDACPTAEIHFDNCYVPNENILGYFNRGEVLLNHALEWERCFEFVSHIGAMRRIMDRCIEHVNTRKQFNKYIGENQSISHKISDMQVSIEMAELMMYKIAWLKDQGKTAYLETCIFKLYVSEHYIQACRDALQIFGGYGYTKEYEIERELRDALGCSIYSGTNEIQKNAIYNMASVNSYY